MIFDMRLQQGWRARNSIQYATYVLKTHKMDISAYWEAIYVHFGIGRGIKKFHKSDL